MCFSATASFVTAAVTGAIGIGSLKRISKLREAPFAATPILFAAQQSIEGLLWLYLPAAPDGPTSTLLTLLFLLFAEVFWPVYAPLAVLLIEPIRRRRNLMILCLLAGAGVAAYFLWRILAYPHTAHVLDGHIVYVTEHPHPDAIVVAYMAATGLALALSSHRIVVVLAAIILVGSAVSYIFYWQAFVSVWCFFAAAASAVILLHFERVRRQSRLLVRP